MEWLEIFDISLFNVDIIVKLLLLFLEKKANVFIIKWPKEPLSAPNFIIINYIFLNPPDKL